MGHDIVPGAAAQPPRWNVKTMMQIAAVMVVLFVTNVAANAQPQQVHRVYVGASGEKAEQAERIVNGVKAKIGSTSRYALSKKLEGAEILLDILCFNLPGGSACSYSVFTTL